MSNYELAMAASYETAVTIIDYVRGHVVGATYCRGVLTVARDKQPYPWGWFD
jgi:HSP20 family molecular chaperone IbpA